MSVVSRIQTSQISPNPVAAVASESQTMFLTLRRKALAEDAAILLALIAAKSQQHEFGRCQNDESDDKQQEA
jgi:hypothetical protein